MNEPSPEAKQAAERMDAFMGVERRAQALQEFADAATTKLREDVEQNLENIISLIEKNDKLREELEQTRENLYAGLDRDRDDITTPHLATVAVNALVSAREQNAELWQRNRERGAAHQQPSEQDRIER